MGEFVYNNLFFIIAILYCNFVLGFNKISIVFLTSRLKLTTKVENEPYGDEQSQGGEDSQQTKNQQEQHQQYLGDISQGLPEFKPVQTTTEPLPGTFTSLLD